MSGGPSRFAADRFPAGDPEDIPRLFGEKVDRLHFVAAINLTYNGSILAREGLGSVLTFDKLADTGENSELCFCPLTPRLETKLYIIWKKYQVFTPAAQVLLDEMKKFGLTEAPVRKEAVKKSVSFVSSFA